MEKVILFPLLGLGGFIFSLLFSIHFAFSQEKKEAKYTNPFEQAGIKNVKVATLSKGKYQEFHDLDSIVQIGTTLINVNSRKIVGYVANDSTNVIPSPTLISRWMSPDPLAEEYYSLSPYIYAGNNPLYFTDPDGKDLYVPGKEEQDAVMSYLQSTFSGFDASKVFRFSQFRNGKSRLIFDKKSFDKLGVKLGDEESLLLNSFVDGIVENHSLRITYDLTDGGGEPKTDDKGAFAKEYDANGVYEITISHPKSFQVNLLFFETDKSKTSQLSDGDKQRMQSFKNADIFWHELGHPMAWMGGNLFKHKDKDIMKKLGGKREEKYVEEINKFNEANNRMAVGYENLFRIVVNIPLRTGEPSHRGSASYNEVNQLINTVIQKVKNK